MEQYLEAKRAFPDAILFFRMGDFYELFFEDALTAAPVLEIVLTSRDKHKGEDSVPMCGVPYHAGPSYIRRLTEKGYKVAICEQMEDPSQAKGLVRREVVRLVTPGMPLDEESASRNHYLAALAPPAGKSKDARWGLAALDASTGSFPVAELALADLLAELSRLSPAEIVFPEAAALPPGVAEYAKARGRALSARPAADFQPARSEQLLKEQFAVGSLEGFGLSAGSPAYAAAGGLLAYARQANPGGMGHVRELHPFRPGGALVLDESTLENLEIFTSQQGKSGAGTLAAAIDRTVSPAGARCLKGWLLYPLLDLGAIEERLDAVEEISRAAALREELRARLARCADLEKIMGRLCQGRSSPRDLAALAQTLEEAPAVGGLFAKSRAPGLLRRSAPLQGPPGLAIRIRDVLAADPPAAWDEGGFVREGFSKDLDALREVRTGGKAWMARLEAGEREKTGISSLKVRYNRVFGYYIEITKANLRDVPAGYIRKQTLVNAERFITPELKEWEEKVLSADERIAALEKEIFEGLCREVAAEVASVQEVARALSELDVLGAFADQAVRRQYVRPEMHEGGEIRVRDGRHPVVEQLLTEERFVPNAIQLDSQENQVLIITGPNMAGKSTVMRQTALLVLLAQCGSFVPAAEARVGLVDRIFTRVGASDNLARGLSTFMLEMTETAAILRQASPRSLVLMDEIGRGTSTFDGLSIAWAVAEALHDLQGKGVRALFATHYHELTELAAVFPRVQNLTMEVKEWNEKILFLRRLVPGAASRSYGIHVARLAGIPDPVIERAREVLRNLESGEWDAGGLPRLAHGKNEPAAAKEQRQLSLLAGPSDRLLAELRHELGELDPDRLTPLDALSWIAKWKARFEE